MSWNVASRFRKMILGLGLTSGLMMSPVSASAGDVQVQLEGALLKVTGSSTADIIAIAQTASGDIFVSAGAGTTISGRTSLVLRRVSLNAVEMQMEGGNDSVSVRGLRVMNDFFLNLGAGNDRFSTSGPITVGANLSITGESGTDVVNLSDSDIGQDLYIDGGLGILNSTLTRLQVNKGLTLLGDEAADQVTITETVALETIAVETKGGNDRVTLTGCAAFGLSVSTDLGADVITVSDFIAEEAIGLFSGVNNDTVNLQNMMAGTTLIVSVDAGDDLVSAEAVSAVTDAVFEGGDGRDTLRDLGISGGIKKDIKEFEIFP